ncbi:tyrosine phosphatase-like protein [Syncephalis plumigaleata]|nr:tyrosine phosphatase-like protein [Syncephalis plumigaleata]
MAQQNTQPLPAFPLEDTRPIPNFRKNPFRSLISANTAHAYLVLYNVLSCFGWLFVLGIFCGYVQSVGISKALWTSYDVNCSWVQLLTLTACLEIIHAATGLVKAGVATTATQTLVRFLVVTLVSRHLAASVIQHHWSYTIMSITWSISEIVRYLYYVYNATDAGPPLTLTWLRYSLFYVLYPIGAFGEAMQIYVGLDYIKRDYGIAAYAVAIGILVYYPFGLWTMYNHMRKQRRRYLTAAYEMERRVQEAVAAHYARQKQ